MSVSIQEAQDRYPPRGKRLLVTASMMTGMTMVALDTTIANVALPQMQASLGASPEQVIWVLTSYMIASAIMTPLASWLASRFGRKLVMTLSGAGFTLASLGCGLAGSLETMIAARLLQGIAGAGLIPLGQATLLDINRPEDRARAMTMAGLGAMLGPLAGPTLGGWLTDAFSWRWVFLINIPVGIAATIGMLAYMDETRPGEVGRFDLFGFASLSIFLGAFQLVLDRGPHLDWFDSPEVWIEAAIMATFLYLTLVHMFTARNTFIRAAIFADRNFSAGCVVSAVIGIVAFATVPIVTVMMQRLLGYSPLLTGMVGFPRGVGTVLALVVVTSLINRFDARFLLFIGIALSGFSLYLYSRITLHTDETPLLVAGFVQGLGGGLMISPLSVLTFATLPAHFRNEGAAVYSLVRNIGASLGVSGLQMLSTRNSASAAGWLAEGVRPDNPVVQWGAPDFSLDVLPSVARMSREVMLQANMIATIDSMWLAFILALAMAPITLVMRTHRQ